MTSGTDFGDKSKIPSAYFEMRIVLKLILCFTVNAWTYAIIYQASHVENYGIIILSWSLY